jgi:hypothetical protein
LSDIVLTTINAKWTHPSLALRLLKANIGSLENQCEIIEFALRQPLCEKIGPLLAACPSVLGISVSIWNHLATIELLEELEKVWGKNFTTNQHEPTRTGEEREGREEVLTKSTKEEKNTKERGGRPIVILGGSEVSYLPDSANIFKFADYVIRGEGEIAFRTLCESVLQGKNKIFGARTKHLIPNLQDDLAEIKTGYYLYTDEDIAQKLIYVESTRGCPFDCEFCLSAVKTKEQGSAVREFPLEPFLSDMDMLVNRGVRTIKFLDRTFNANINRAVKICEFFLRKLEERRRAGYAPFVVHFEMVPSLFPRELCEILARFPPDSLRLEIGIQTLNPEVCARIHRPGWRNQSINTEKELETIRFLRKNTNAIIHADLIAGLPGEDMQSFGRGFDRLWQAVSEDGDVSQKREAKNTRVEIQLGILKQLPGAPISRHNETFGMRYNCKPPYEIEETSSISKVDLQRVKNFAAFWERLVNRGLLRIEGELVFEKFMSLSDSLFTHFGKNWGIDKNELIKKATDIFKT